MAAYIFRRLILSFFTVCAISALSFFIIELPEGDLATKRLDRTMDFTTGSAQAHGIADELVSTTLSVCEQPTLFVPAMNFIGVNTAVRNF